MARSPFSARHGVVGRFGRQERREGGQPTGIHLFPRVLWTCRRSWRGLVVGARPASSRACPSSFASGHASRRFTELFHAYI